MLGIRFILQPFQAGYHRLPAFPTSCVVREVQAASEAAAAAPNQGYHHCRGWIAAQGDRLAL